MMSLWDALRMNMMISYQELVRTFLNPGQPGQTFIHKSLEKIRNTKKMISGRDIQIEVDGGVNLDNVKQVKEAGADLIVVGGALFNKQPHESYQALKIAVQ